MSCLTDGFVYFCILLTPPSRIWDSSDAQEQAVSSSGTELCTKGPGRQDHRAKAPDYALLGRVLWKPHRGAAGSWILYPWQPGPGNERIGAPGPKVKGISHHSMPRCQPRPGPLAQTPVLD